MLPPFDPRWLLPTANHNPALTLTALSAKSWCSQRTQPRLFVMPSLSCMWGEWQFQPLPSEERRGERQQEETAGERNKRSCGTNHVIYSSCLEEDLSYQVYILASILRMKKTRQRGKIASSGSHSKGGRIQNLVGVTRSF